MDKKNLKKILTTLKKLPKNNSKSARKKYLNSCTENEIHAICGACNNLLRDNIKISKSRKSYLRKKLNPIKNDLRKLSKSNTSVKKKRELLKKDQTGKGVFSLLASVIIPSIISAIAGK